MQYQHKFYHGEVGAPFSKLYTATFLSNQAQNTDINFPRGRKGLFFLKLYTAAFLFTQAQNTNINFTCQSGYNKVKLEKVLQKQNQGNHNPAKDNITRSKTSCFCSQSLSLPEEIKK